MPLTVDQHKSSQNAIVELYEIDATAIGGGVYYLSPTVDASASSIIWNGITFTPFPVKSDGWTKSSAGAPPRPKLYVGTVNKLIQGAVNSLNDLVGARVIYRRIFEQYLDNGSTPDFTATFPISDYIISKKISQDKNKIIFELMSFLDKEGIKLPKRLMIRNDFPGIARTRISK